MTTYSDCKLKLLCVVTLSLIQLLDNMHTKPLVLVRSHYIARGCYSAHVYLYS